MTAYEFDGEKYRLNAFNALNPTEGSCGILGAPEGERGNAEKDTSRTARISRHSAGSGYTRRSRVLMHRCRK